MIGGIIMRLIAIANISNGRNTVGFRLLDIDTKQIKDVQINDIRSVLSIGTIQIDNLKIKDGTIAGSNGSTDRLPKIINGQLIGKSPLIVLNQIGNTGYTVSDYKGTICSVKVKDAIDYAKTHGISNGKVVTKDRTEFISAIDGSYEVKEQAEHYNNSKEKRDIANAKLGIVNIPYRVIEHGGMKLMRTDIEEITIYEPVKFIPAKTFVGCNKLKHVILSNGLMLIGKWAFHGCSELLDINIPEGLEIIESNAFERCKSLIRITLPTDLGDKLEEDMFKYCTSLSEINIPEGVETIGACAFLGCASLAKITLPDSIREIEQYAFDGCGYLLEINLPEGLETIGAYAFRSCEGLTAINVPKGLKKVYKDAFKDCSEAVQNKFKVYND